jgi:hypothetical protein
MLLLVRAAGPCFPLAGGFHSLSQLVSSMTDYTLLEISKIPAELVTVHKNTWPLLRSVDLSIFLKNLVIYLLRQPL